MLERQCWKELGNAAPVDGVLEAWGQCDPGRFTDCRSNAHPPVQRRSTAKEWSVEALRRARLYIRAGRSISRWFVGWYRRKGVPIKPGGGGVSECEGGW